MNTEAARAVDRGARLLDQREPGWYTRIRLDRFRTASVNECVLGQLFGDFSLGRDLLISELPGYGDEALFGVEYGFDRWAFQPLDYTYEDLDQAWLAEIQIRRESEGTRN